MTLDHLYFLMLAALFTHELDAVKRHEWRVLPLTSFLPERLGEQVFIWAHVPLFFGIFLASQGAFAEGFRVGMSAFAVVHVGLHWLFRNHPAYEFNNGSSWALILLAGGAGGAYVAAALAA